MLTNRNQVFRVPNWFDPVIIFFTLLVVYRATASLRLTWANFGNDGGDFLAAVLTGGIPHPTGYPTYILLGRLFQWLPLGDPYSSLVALSYVPVAIAACLFAVWITSFEPKLRLVGFIASMTWGLSPLLWSQAVIIEVYGLQSLFTVLALIWSRLLFREQKIPLVRLGFLAFCFGLGLGNHVTLILFGPIIFIGLIYYWKHHGFVGFLPQIGCVGIGLLVYLYLPLSAKNFPPINWGNPQSFDGFFWLISGRPYQSFWGKLEGAQLIDRIFSWAAMLRGQFGIVGIILGVIGGFEFLQKRNGPGAYVGLWVFLSYLIFSIGYNTADSNVYLIPVFMIFAGWIGYSLVAINTLGHFKYTHYFSRFVIMLMFATLLFRLPETFKIINPREDDRPATYAEQALEQLPSNALVLTSIDLDTFPLWAYHFGLEWRKDLKVIVMPLTRFQWYQETLIHTYRDLIFPPVQVGDSGTDSWGKDLIELNDQYPVCQSKIKQDEIASISFSCTEGTTIFIDWNEK